MTEEICTREEYVHHAELAGALESFRDGDIRGSIVAAQYPSEDHGRVKLTWAWTEEIDDK